VQAFYLMMPDVLNETKPGCASFYSELHGKRQGANLSDIMHRFSNPSYLFLSFSSLIA